MLKVKNLKHKFKDFSLENINLEIPSSYVLAVLGANGAGKSTLIKLITHALEKQDGEILLNGEKDYRHTMSYAPSYFPFNENYKIKELNKMMSLFYKEWDQKAFSHYCDKYSINVKEKINKLSFGMKQRLLIAVSLSHKAKLVVLDEASEGIDPFIRDEILDDLREYIYKYRPILVIASHNLEQYENFVDHVIY